jgi:hypothetical protein
MKLHQVLLSITLPPCALNQGLFKVDYNNNIRVPKQADAAHLSAVSLRPYDTNDQKDVADGAIHHV